MNHSPHSSSAAVDRPASAPVPMDPAASTGADALCACLDDDPVAAWKSPLSSASSLPDFDPLDACVSLIEDFEPGPTAAPAPAPAASAAAPASKQEPEPWPPAAPTAERLKYPITIATNALARRQQPPPPPKLEPVAVPQVPPPFLAAAAAAPKLGTRPDVPAFGASFGEPGPAPSKVAPGVPPTLLTSEDKLFELPMSTSPIVSPLSETSDGWDLGPTPPPDLTPQLHGAPDCTTGDPRNRGFPDKGFDGDMWRRPARSSHVAPIPPAIAGTLFTQTPRVQNDEAAGGLSRPNPMYYTVTPQATTITTSTTTATTLMPSVLPSSACPQPRLPPPSPRAGPPTTRAAAVLQPAPEGARPPGARGGERERAEGAGAGIAKKRKPKRYSRPVASNFCHICARTQRDTQKTVCSNIHRQLCRKAVCRKCFKENGWDWASASAPGSGWLCPHCMAVCPSRARCHVYNRTNERRRLDNRRRRSRMAQVPM